MGLADDVAYVSILFASIGFGKLFRLIPPEVEGGIKYYWRRRWVSTVVGILICCLVSGWHTLHLLVQIAGNAAIVLGTPVRKCHLYSFAWCFSYLTFFRLSAWLGLPPPPSHTNAIILILTLKLVGLAFEVHDTAARHAQDAAGGYGDVSPSLSGIVHYSLGHIGLITGPYYKYSVWQGLYQDSWNPAHTSHTGWGVCEEAALTRARHVPYYVGAFLLSGYLFPISVVETAEWQQSSGFLWKVFYMMPVFFNFRMRIYAGFTLSECACIMAGLGAYPVTSEPRPGQGPTKLDKLAVAVKESGEEAEDADSDDRINFETVHNIDEWGSDFAPSMRDALRCWNMTVQHWLVVVVYKRFPIRSLRTTVVMLVSSIWHGVHPGYYLSLGSVPLCLLVEDFYKHLIRSRLSESGKATYDWANWFIRMRWFDYLGMGFLLLRVDATLAYWSSVFFIGHLSLGVFYLLGLVLAKPLVSKVWKEKEK